MTPDEDRVDRVLLLLDPKFKQGALNDISSWQYDGQPLSPRQEWLIWSLRIEDADMATQILRMVIELNRAGGRQIAPAAAEQLVRNTQRFLDGDAKSH